ncbi:MAG: BON domain-containing protein [Mariniblastus sp.]|nr:BON domain-containing protein [Mariniblastus sp.]
MRVFMLGIAVAVAALMPSVCMANDQEIADYVKTKLQTEQQNGNLSGFNVDMRVDNGAVWFSGFVSSAEQEQLILRTAQDAGHLGVVQVVDDIEIRPAASTPVAPTTPAVTVAPAQSAQVVYQQPEQVPAQVQFAQAPQTTVATPVRQVMPAQMVQQRRMQALPAASAGNQPLAFASASSMVRSDCGGCGNCANCMGGANAAAMGTGAMATGAPNLPGYAWPGYAAHPNYSAVTYPKQYSASAWPYIGPFYPYPQVPLGWRKVSLEWSDGWWFLDFNDTNQW